MARIRSTTTDDPIMQVLGDYIQQHRPEYCVTYTRMRPVALWVTRQRYLDDGTIVGVGWCRAGILSLSVVGSHGFLDPRYPTTHYDPTNQDSWDQLLVRLVEYVTILDEEPT